MELAVFIDTEFHSIPGQLLVDLLGMTDQIVHQITILTEKAGQRLRIRTLLPCF